MGTSPYTGTTNPDTDNGTFSNGYQPDNVDGNKLSKVKGVKSDPKITVNGNEQSVWQTGSGSDAKYYYWSGAENVYHELTFGELVELGIKSPIPSLSPEEINYNTIKNNYFSSGLGIKPR